jgi:hypothetical protein
MFSIKYQIRQKSFLKEYNITHGNRYYHQLRKCYVFFFWFFFSSKEKKKKIHLNVMLTNARLEHELCMQEMFCVENAFP